MCLRQYVKMSEMLRQNIQPGYYGLSQTHDTRVPLPLYDPCCVEGVKNGSA
jgi:hypothetical protein